MNTKLLMSASALTLGVIGIAMLFLPEELLSSVGKEPDAFLKLSSQALGAVYLGFAYLNWMAKNNLIGGIYSKPLAMGNLMHFLILAITLIKFMLTTEPVFPVVMWIITAVYTVLALSFARVTFGRPNLD